MLILDLISEAATTLATRSARAEAEWIVGYVLGKSRDQTLSRTELQLRARDGIREEWVTAVREIVRRRVLGEPLQYILGEAWFGMNRYRVRPGVLIPRPETEILVEEAVRGLTAAQGPKLIWEMGVGSGIVLGEILRRVPDSSGYGTEISSVALEVSRSNWEELGLGARVEVLRAEPREGVECFDRYSVPYPTLLISNPPYLLESETEVEPAVRQTEPSEALFAPSNDPLFFYRNMAQSGIPWILAEIPHERATEIEALWKSNGYQVRLVMDLTGRPRVAEGRKPKESKS
jgi:release factor glutamine methyltransferase